MSSKFFQGQLQRFMQETPSFYYDISQKLKPLVFSFMVRAEIGRKWQPKPWTVQLQPSSGRIGQVFISPAIVIRRTKNVNFCVRINSAIEFD